MQNLDDKRIDRQDWKRWFSNTLSPVLAQVLRNCFRTRLWGRTDLAITVRLIVLWCARHKPLGIKQASLHTKLITELTVGTKLISSSWGRRLSR